MEKLILVSEIFGPVIQGEGALIGKPTVFVRTGGCDYRCSWCDTLYAVLPEYRGEWTPMTPQAIADKVLRLTGGQRILVTLSGGNPALQPLEPLLDRGGERGLTFALETQGSHAQDWFAKLDYLVLSPKGPSSAMAAQWDSLAACVAAGASAQTVLKIVVFEEADYQFARAAAARFPELPVYLQPGTAPPQSTGDVPDMNAIARRLEWLVQCTVRDGWENVTILPQLHVLLWGHRRGV